jgi:hypothetical protein
MIVFDSSECILGVLQHNDANAYDVMPSFSSSNTRGVTSCFQVFGVFKRHLFELHSDLVLCECGGQISPGSTRRLEDLAKGSGPDVSQGHPFVGLGSNAWRTGSTQDRINSSPDDPTDLSNIHNNNPTFPRCVLRCRN